MNKEKAAELISSGLIPLMKDEQSKLKALEVPAGDEEAISKMLEARSKAIEDIEADPLAALTKSSPLTAFTAQQRAYGLQCGL